ncbi:MAG: riboflavin biosynthesis protein RibD [Deltaproteobacteria bacterium CG11_big_fil_rev_8_21_14_0_20_49_13]|nr:MAG: riboflavin biosynthesis protein RibD [Deltaproteobacteria bacterium CG11_big_fil_rev_8_21_14_0_20_49_13]
MPKSRDILKTEAFMQRALHLAFRGYGLTSPNPMVGAVIVKNGKVIAEGFHKGSGLPHAEINALRRVGKKAKGATLYINLEPCSHFGRTPPCADAIIKAGIKQVIYGMKDPNPLVSGQGLKKLKKAGIKVEGPILEGACLRLNLPFIKHIRTGLPFVTAKIALTLDGKIADYKGDSKWITNESSRTYTHVLRAGVDVVMVGYNTAKKDKPKLNVRLPGYKGRQPVPIVVSLRAQKGRGNLHRKVDLKKLLKELGAAGFQSILVEGGGELQSEMIRKRLVNRFVVFVSTKLLGGKGLPWTRDIGPVSIKSPVKIIPEQVFMLGDDIVIEGLPSY